MCINTGTYICDIYKKIDRNIIVIVHWNIVYEKYLDPIYEKPLTLTVKKEM